MINLIDELQWRGMIQDIMPGTAERLAKEKITAYIGFDPTADSLHVGSLLPICLLMHLQRLGHTPLALVGGATGMVGDPSGKSSERILLKEEELNHNLDCIKKQLENFLDFSPTISNPAKVVNNYDWFKSYNFLEFIRDIGKHITVNYMMAKDSVKSRIESEQGISFTEFSYQLIQGYDFLWLFNNHNCQMQMGGSDQWGNIVTGAELIRKKTAKTCMAFTCPLIKKSDGTKFGKSSDGNVWLDSKKTSPYHFYQFWLSTSDTDALDWVKKFTFLSQQEVSTLYEEFKRAPHKRLLQHTLADMLTTMVHGKQATTQAQITSDALFKNANIDFFKRLSLTEFEDVFKGVSLHTFNKSAVDNTINIVDFLFECKIFKSKGEARKAIDNNSISINKSKIDSSDFNITKQHILFGKYILINKGKKNFHLVNV